LHESTTCQITGRKTINEKVSLIRKLTCAFSSDTASELNVLGHDSDTLRMNCAKIGIFKEAYKVRFRRLLKGENGGRLKAEVGLEVLGDFAHETLERQLANEEVGCLLILADLAQGNGTGPVAMGLLDAANGRSRLAGGLGCELLPGGFASGRLASGLLRASHR
jgi:hypothetical protein